MQNVIIRISPITSKPVIFFPETSKAGKIEGYTEGRRLQLDEDYYTASAPMETEQAKQIAKAYAASVNVPEHDIYVRTRRPKTVAKQRKTNDSNLVLVKNEKKAEQESQQDYRSANEKAGKEDALQKAAQSLQDTHTEEKKASASNPEGAVVKPQEKKAKRGYVKRSQAKSQSAMARYLKELGQAAETVPAAPEVQAAPTMDEDSLKEQKLLTAMKLIKEIGSEVKPSLLKAIMDLL